MKDNKIKELFDDTPIPDRLQPDNIAKMLKEKSSQQKNDINKNPPPESTIETIQPTKNGRNIKLVSRIVASVAACAVLTFGLVTYFDNQDNTIPRETNVAFETELAPAKDYDELYKTFQKVYSQSDKTHYTIADFFSNIFGGGTKDDAMYDSSVNDIYEIEEAAPAIATDEAPDGMGADTATDSSSDYSETHEQVEGVGEADIIKTDGEHIYYIANNTLYIVKNDDGKMTLLSEIEKENILPREMYISGNKVILISNKAESYENTTDGYLGDVPNNMIVDSCCPEYYYTNDLQVDIIDTADKANPKVINTHAQNGNYISSRMIDNNLYVITDYNSNVYRALEDKDNLEQYVPQYSENDVESFIAPEDICIPDYVSNTNYTIVAGFDITADEPLVSIKALLGYNGTVYSSQDNIYIAGQKWSNNSQKTTIARFSIDNGELTHTGFGKVNGVILNQFSMDEYNGYFRIATTDYNYNNGEQTNGVYVLDSELKTVGKLTGLAKTEQIKSVRFENDLCYIVTFRQTDPLFTIDLSDPENPKETSELKINGYSAYLINYGEGKLLGFGVDADDNGIQTGLKLSMFETSDSQDVTEITSVSLGDDLQWASSPGIYNHKSLLIDAEKNIIGIPVSFYDGIDQCDRYYLYEFSNNEFNLKGMLETHNINWLYQFSRGMYIDDVVFAFSQGRIVSASMDDMSMISSLDLIDPTSFDENGNLVKPIEEPIIID